MTASSLPLENEFWRFSLAVYGAPGVAAECLALQEALSIDVNLLLFCAWLGAARGVTLKTEDIESVESIVTSWHRQVVRPIRSARQQLKAFAQPEADELRARVKRIELDAEQIEQAMLFTHALVRGPEAAKGDPRHSMQTNVWKYLQTRPAAPGVALSTQHLTDAAIGYVGRIR